MGLRRRSCEKEVGFLTVCRIMYDFKSDTLKLKINKREIGINPSEICYCQADRCYSRVFLKSGKSYLISEPLKRLEKRLPQENFLRCHRSYLINTQEIESINIKERVIYQKLYQIPFSYQKIIKLLSEDRLG